MHPDLAVESARWVLKYDRYSPNILWHLVFHHLRRMDLASAEIYLNRLKAIGRDWKEIDQIQQVYDQTEKEIMENAE